MTVDERLERLVAQHEALTQTVELLALQIRDMNERGEERSRAAAAGNQQIQENSAPLLPITATLAGAGSEDDQDQNNS